MLKKLFFKKRIEISPIDSDEREKAVSLTDVKKEHIFRYNLAKELTESVFGDKRTFGLDIFCGNGYGSYFLGKFLKNTHITAIDGSKDAVKIAKKFYNLPNIKYLNRVYPFKLKKNIYDYIVCFESLEHIDCGINFLTELKFSLKCGGILIISTPNDTILPLDINPNKYHKVQYTYKKLSEVLDNAGFEIINTFGQNIFSLDCNNKITGVLPVKDRQINNNLHSQNMILCCKSKT